ncbi:hypothetical protein [Streptosporangium sp. NPDC048865]
MADDTLDDRALAGNNTPLMILAWAWVGLPFAYGVYELFQKLTQLFGG